MSSSDEDLTVYRKALAFAREDYRQRKEALKGLISERETLDRKVRLLRSIVTNLGALLGEPVDLPADPKPLSIRRSHDRWR